MPSAIRYVPPTDTSRGLFSPAVLSERQRRREKYRTALAYYEGNHPDQLLVEDDEPDDNVIVNLVKMAGDRTASFLFADLPTFEIDPSSIEPTKEEQFLIDFLNENGGLSTLTKLALRGFLAGHCFVRVKPPQHDDMKPKMIVLDPTSVTVFWRADDVGDVLWYELRYGVGDTVRIQDFVFDEISREWRIYTYEAGVSQDKLGILDIPTSHGEPDLAGVYLDLIQFGANFKQVGNVAIHSSPIPPIVDFPHLPHPDDYYGLGEFTQKDLQDVINRIASELNRIVRENADPVDVLTGADIDEIKNSGEIINIPATGAKVTRLEMKGDLAGIRITLEKMMEIYLAVARVVLLKGEPKDLQRVTNASVRTLFLDALSKNTVLQSSYGRGLILICKLALMMGYQSKQITKNPQDLKIKVNFKQPLPTDMKEVADINGIMVNMGARSLRTAATLMGDVWSFEVAAMEKESEIAQERQKEQMQLMQEFSSDEKTSNLDQSKENA